MDSIGKMAERILMALFCFAAPAVLFVLADESFREQRMSALINEFIMEAVRDGILTREEYLVFAEAVAGLGEEYGIALEHHSYVEEPQYEYVDEEAIREYFGERNVLSKRNLPIETVEFPDFDTGEMRLQEATNASVLSASSPGGYVPLPDDDAPDGAVYQPVLPVQECYSGERLVTVVRVQVNGVAYCFEADSVAVTGEGTASVPLTYRREPIPAAVMATVYPRTYVCEKGHEVPYTKTMIESYKATGDVGPCAFCAMEPEAITPSISSIVGEAGTPWEAFLLSFTVTYKDGHAETIASDAEGLYHDYDADYCGSQGVSVSYQGLVAECLTAELHGRGCAACGRRCDGRSFSDYERFAYCDGCLAAAPFYLGDTFVQENVAHHEEIIEALDAEGSYRFSRGDYLKVSVAYAANRQGFLFFCRSRTVPVVAGGYIRTDGKR